MNDRTIRICMAFNHFQYSDGVARSAIGIANHLCSTGNVSVTLRPIFKFDDTACELLNPGVEIKPLFKTYFHGLSKIVSCIPLGVLHDIVFGKNNYDIEVGFQHGTATKAAVSGKNKQCKHYLWMHGYDEGLTLKKFFKKADKIVCVSKFNANRLKNELQTDVPIEYCYNPLDERKIIEQGRENVPVKRDNNIQFITVGRLSEEKGYLRLIKVMGRLLSEGYSFGLWIVGNGPQKQLLEQFIQENSLNDNIILLGEQKNPHKFTGKADVFICSSYSEGYSTACTEAIILGVPVITTCVSGGQEIIDDSEAGILTGMEDEDLYQALKSVLDNPKVVEKWKQTLSNTKGKFFYDYRVKKIDTVLEIETGA